MQNLPQISPTDLSQYLRLRSCDKYLWFRLRERATGQSVMEAFGIVPHPISPLLRDIGEQFESSVEKKVALSHRTIHATGKSVIAQNTQLISPLNSQMKDSNNDASSSSATLINDVIKDLSVGETVVLFQVPLAANIWGWHLTGLADLIRLERCKDNRYEILIADTKRSGSLMLGYWMQVALYAAMISARLGLDINSTIDSSYRIRIGILHRREDTNSEGSLHREAEQLLGVDDKLANLVISDDIEPYLWTASDLLEHQDSPAKRILELPMEDAFFALGVHCDGCTYQEYCLRQCHEQRDLSLIHIRPVEKQALWEVGIRTIDDLVKMGTSNEGEIIPNLSISRTPELSDSWNTQMSTYDNAPKRRKVVNDFTPRMRSRIQELILRATAIQTSRRKSGNLVRDFSRVSSN